MNMYRHRRRVSGESEISYLMLLFTIAFGVMLGNLASNWITARVLTIQAEAALKTLSGKSAEQARRAKERADAQSEHSRAAQVAEQELQMQRRRADREGVRLAQSCEEWRRADAQLSSYTTKSEMAKYCGQLDRYVQTGGH